MKIKKVQFSTVISDLWGRDGYQSHIEVGREYWYYFGEDTQAYKLTHKHWNKIKITYVRSGCLFFTLPDAPDFEEEFCPIKCFMTSQFVLAEIDPIKDLGEENLEDIEASKLKYCFNTYHTIVKNWPNEKEVEIDENELLNKFGNSVEYICIKALEKRKGDS